MDQYMTINPFGTAGLEEDCLRDKFEEQKVTVKLVVEDGVEVARIFEEGEEIIFGPERSVVMTASVGYVEAVRRVWVIPTKVEKQLAMINILAEQQHWERKCQVVVGGMCVATFSVDQQKYRAMVMEFLRTEKVLVRFVDFGNTE